MARQLCFCKAHGGRRPRTPAAEAPDKLPAQQGLPRPQVQC